LVAEPGIMSLVRLLAVDGILNADGRNFVGRLAWHPTDRELDQMDERECTCAWCVTGETWVMVAEVIDAHYALAMDGFDLGARQYSF
jgi:hypothetical protein